MASNISVKAVVSVQLTATGFLMNIGLGQGLDGISDLFFGNALKLELVSSELNPIVAFEELERKYPEIMDALGFAQMMAESRRKKAQAGKTSLPPPPKNQRNKRLPEESVEPASSGAANPSSPSTQTPKRRRLPPKGDKGKGKAVEESGERSAEEEPLEEAEYEITRRDTGVVFGSDQTFSELTPKELRVRWRKAMGQLVSDKDLAQLASVPAKTRVNELLAIQAEMNIRMQFEITTALGSEMVQANLEDLKKKNREMNAKLVRQNDQIMSLNRENKGLHHSLEQMHEKCRFLKEAVLVREKQLSLKKRIVKEWVKTDEGRQFMAKVGATACSQGQRVRELMDKFAHEKLQATPDWEAFSAAAEEEYDRALSQTQQEMQELEGEDPDADEEAADKEAWEKVLPGEVEARFKDFDFAHYDISVPSRPTTPVSSPIAAVPLLPRPQIVQATPAVPRSPAVSRRMGSVFGEEDVEENMELDPLFSVEELMEG
ncbi:unnamed protein product [Amaranthus hypochondriacus]